MNALYKINKSRILKPYIVNGGLKEYIADIPGIILGENQRGYAIIFHPDKYYVFDICRKEKSGYTSVDQCYSLFNKKIYSYFTRDELTEIIGNTCTNMLKVFNSPAKTSNH